MVYQWLDMLYIEIRGCQKDDVSCEQKPCTCIYTYNYLPTCALFHNRKKSGHFAFLICKSTDGHLKSSPSYRELAPNPIGYEHLGHNVFSISRPQAITNPIPNASYASIQASIIWVAGTFPSCAEVFPPTCLKAMVTDLRRQIM